MSILNFNITDKFRISRKYLAVLHFSKKIPKNISEKYFFLEFLVFSENFRCFQYFRYVIYHYQTFKCKSVGVILQSEVYSLPCGSILESSFVKFFPRLKSLFLILLLDGCGGLDSIVRCLLKVKRFDDR